MIRFMSDRRVLATSAAVITAAILAFLVGTYPSWRKAIGVDGPDLASLLPSRTGTPGSEPAAHQQTTDVSVAQTEGNATGQPAPQATSPQPKAETASAPAPVSAGAAQTQTAAEDSKVAERARGAGPADQPAASERGPSFDVVRVEPTGESVVAGRAAPGAEIVLLDQGQPIARAKADANGQVAFVPPALTPGEHSLMLSVGEPNAAGTVSSQSVAVSVPAQGKTAPLVALIAPGQPTRILSAPPPANSGPAAASGSSGSAPAVAVSSIDVEDLGGVYATGKAAPDSQCRVYLNGSFVAAVTAGKDGTWSLKIKRGMRPGRYTVRVDQLQSAAGQVQARAEVPFEYPSRAPEGVSLLRPKAAAKNAPAVQPGASTATPAETVGGSAVTALAAATPAATGQSPAQNTTADAATIPAKADPTIVPQLLTTKVIRGDSLWRISRKMLGHGLRYTQIYAANTTQIRDPKLIYPGQIFVMPQSTP